MSSAAQHPTSSGLERDARRMHADDRPLSPGSVAIECEDHLAPEFILVHQQSAQNLDVIDAERGLLEAEQTRIEAERAFRFAMADLFKALGGAKALPKT